MVAEGKLTPEQAETHPQRSILTRALGAEPEVDVDTLEIQLQIGDRLVLCSDGLSSVIGEDQILATLHDSKDLKETCKRLIEAANQRGGPDNITVVVVEVTGVPEVRAGVRAAPPAPRREMSPPARAARPGAGGPGTRVDLDTGRRHRSALGAWVGVRSWVNRSYFVGVSDGVVTIYRGLPTEFAGIELNHVEERTTKPVDRGVGSLAVAARRRDPRGQPPGGARHRGAHNDDTRSPRYTDPIADPDHDMSRRNAELGLVILALVLTGGAYLLVQFARLGHDPGVVLLLHRRVRGAWPWPRTS